MGYETETENFSSPEEQPFDEEVPALTSVQPASTTTPAKAWVTGWRGLAIGLGVGATIATLIAHLPPGSKAPADPPVPQPTASVTGQSVTVAPAKLAPIAQTIATQGSVEAREWVSVLPKSAGVQIKELRVDDGDRVEVGQAIAVLDNSVQEDRLHQAEAQLASVQAQLASAQAQLASAKTGVRQKQAILRQQQASLAEAESNLKRYQGLAQEGVVTQQDLESRSTSAATSRESVSVAQANISSAQAEVDRAQAEVNRAQAEVQNSLARVQELVTQRNQATVVQAPASGVIAKKTAKVGDLTGTNPLFSIIRDGAMELQVKVPETLLPQVKFGALAQVTSDADKRIRLQGRVREIDPIVDDKTRQATVKIDLPATAQLKPGMFLRAALTVQTTQAIAVPAKAVLPKPDGGSLVYVLTGNNTVRAQSVEVGSRQDAADPDRATIEIKRGLKLGDQVVVAGAGYLKDGDRVTVVRD